MTQFNTKKLPYLILFFVFVLFASYLRFDHFIGLPIEGDEWFQIGFSTGSLEPFWRWHQWPDINCFQGSYALNYPLINLFPDHIWIIRIPHILITLSGFVLLFLIGLRYYRSLFGFGVCFTIMAVNTTLILHSFEIRPYAALPTLALLTFYFWDKLFTTDWILKPWQKWMWGLTVILATNFHAYGLFITFLPLLYQIFRARDLGRLSAVLKQYRNFLFLIIVPAVGLWIYFAIGSKVMHPGSFFGEDQHTFRYFANPLENPIQFSKNILGNLFGNKSLYVLLFGLCGLLTGSSTEKKQKILFFLILVVMALQCVMIPSLQKGYLFVQRQFIWVIPFFALWMGWLWDSLYAALRRRIKAG